MLDSFLSYIAQQRKTPGFFRDIVAAPVDLLPDYPVKGLPSHLKANLPGGIIRLGEHVRLIAQDGVASSQRVDFTGSRVAIIAHWSKDGSIAPYVAFFLRCLKEQGWRILLACGREPYSGQGILRLCDAVVFRNCPGYDFTSWKAAFEMFPSLFAAEEILLANDSIFAPIGSLAHVHQAMESVTCDFWGLVASRERLRHLQSYYLVFRAATIRHPAFAAFWNAVDCISDKFETILRYELVLSPWLSYQGLAPAAYVPFQALPDTNINPSYYFWRELLALYHAPILKRDLVRTYRDHPTLSGWEQLVKRLGYNPALILREIEL